jgi:hypothetical protein
MELPVYLLLDLIGRLMRVLAQAGFVDIATVHAQIAVDDLHDAPRRMTVKRRR